jgi:plasmid stabilization system protein ParE
MKYLLHEDAADDIRDAGNFYRERAGSVLAQAFFNSFEQAMALLLRYPEGGAPWLQKRRRLVMTRFPYAIVYDIAGEEIRVYAVAHHSRQPDYWQKRKWPTV